MYQKSIELYGDGIGFVDYVTHSGTDLTVVNSARVSFGVDIPALWSIVGLLSALLYLCMSDLNITATEHGVTMRSLAGIPM